MIQLVKSPKELRLGNLIFVDRFVFPPNFIAAQPSIVGEGFEDSINDKTQNVAYLNATQKWMRQLFTEEKDGCLCKGKFIAEKVQDEGHMEFPLWKISYKKKIFFFFPKTYKAEIQFIHEVQNYYKDWVGEELFDQPIITAEQKLK